MVQMSLQDAAIKTRKLVKVGNRVMADLGRF